MKRNLVALGLLAAAGTASAQSSVTLGGIIDTGVTFGRGSVADRVQLTSGNMATSRLIFRGTEDLGGGLSASFWLEAGLNIDDGSGQATNTNNQTSGGNLSCTVATTTTTATTANPAIAGTALTSTSTSTSTCTPAINGAQGMTFNRRSTVSLAGGWGEVRLGRDYVPQYWNRSVFDPFGIVGVGQTVISNLNITGITSVRASNSIGYLLPGSLGGWYGQAMYHLGENAGNVGVTKRDGSGYGVRIGYAAGPFNIAAATGYTRYAAGAVHQSNIGGRWDFAMVKLMAQYERERAGLREADGWLVGGLVPVGAGEVRVSYSRFHIDPPGNVAEPRATKIALGYVHNLSKRTALYATYARVRNSAGGTLGLGGATTAANQGSSGLDLGIRHTF
ncbi:porin [Ramlibacter albus]|uniref:Porin n=1 Tax=Ramlibacter albus TaxID=2079448 RepID=A0A923M7D4_9BURK|nr:porin [Ramlibacter albus]MBC5763922.1 porin [Ramlibacter albus]